MASLGNSRLKQVWDLSSAYQQLEYKLWSIVSYIKSFLVCEFGGFEKVLRDVSICA